MSLRPPAILAAFCLAAAANAGEPATNRVIRTAAELSQALAAGFEATGHAKFDVVVTVTQPCSEESRTFSAEDSSGPILMHEASAWKNGVSTKDQPVLHRGDRIRAMGHIVLWEPRNIPRPVP